MDACLAVEREIDKVLGKFRDIDRQSSGTLTELLQHIEVIRQELQESEYDVPFLDMTVCLVSQFGLFLFGSLLSVLSTETRPVSLKWIARKFPTTRNNVSVTC